LAAMNQDDAAVLAYRHALQLDPSDPNARHNLESVLWRKQHPQDKKKNNPQPDGGSDPHADGGQPDAGPDGGASDGGQPDAGPSGNDGGADGGSDGGGQGDGGNQADGGNPQGDGGAGDGGSSQDGGNPSDGGGQGQGSGAEDGGGADAGQPNPDQMAEDQAGRDGGEGDDRKPISQQDAERLLDSMRRNEKNLQLWKYKPRGVKRNHDVDKDW
jgi:hypothetical protein